MTWQTPPFAETVVPPDAPGPRGPRPLTAVAWVVIVLGTIGAIAMHFLPMEGGDDGDDPIGLVLMRIQAQYMVGAAEFQGGAGMLYGYAADLNAGTIAQRQRFVPLAAELVGPAEAAKKVAALEKLVFELAQDADEPVLDETQVEVQEIFHTLYPGGAVETPRVDALDQAQRERLVEALGWFGELAITPPGSGDAARDAVLAPARKVFTIMIVVAIGIVGAGFVGFVGLVIVGVLTLTGRMRGGLRPGIAPHGIYAETFAVWMPLFFGLQIVAGLVGTALSAPVMLLAALAFLISLVALAWPVIRGIPWRDVRQDIGWTLGRQPLAEPLLGVGGYFMMLPLMAVGILLTLFFLFLQGVFAGPPAPLAPTGGPAHPIILEVANGGWGARIQILLVAAVAAPIVEETMFRGVLYRHLRGASARLGIGTSVLLSTSLSAFIFAIIHPQGWVAVPALMSLAYAFALAREWRGTVIPAVIMHGINNAVVMTMLFGLLSA